MIRLPAVLTAPSLHAPTVRLRIYIQLVVASGAIVIVRSLAELPQTPHPIEWLTFSLMAILIGCFRLKMALVPASISVSDTLFIAMVLLFGPAPATVALAIDSGAISWRLNHSWRRILFNATAPALAVWAAGRLFFVLARVPPLANGGRQTVTLIAPLMVSALVYFGLNTFMLAIALGLEAGRAPFALWRTHFKWLCIEYLASASLAFCLIPLIRQFGIAVGALIAPLIAVIHLTLRASFGRLEDAQSHFADLDRLYRSTVETLAMAIDAKDDVTHSHVRRVQAYAVGVARALAMTDDSALRAIEIAALLHDTGKLAVPQHILNKPGTLTAAEFEKMKLHVDVGGDILALVEFPYPVVPIVRCHHENWDGSGYPRGVAGDSIPIGARILSVVDCFDALTSDRPYRPRMTDHAAVAILRERSGSMYDPHVVETFIRIRDTIAISHSPPPMRLIHGLKESAAETASHSIVPDSVLEEMSVGAFGHLAEHSNGHNRLSSVMMLGSEVLGEVFPGCSGAWYMPDPEHDGLVVTKAFGPSAPALMGLHTSIGEGLSGWVAANKQPIYDADARLDLRERHESIVPPVARCMSVPLLDDDALLGVLTVYSPEWEGFSDHSTRAIQRLTALLTVAIHGHVRPAVAASRTVQ